MRVMAKKTDPITIATIWHYIQRVCREMRYTAERTATNVLVVTLHDIQGLSHEEIAEIMDCNIGTVRSRLFYARQQLQAYLSDYLK